MGINSSWLHICVVWLLAALLMSRHSTVQAKKKGSDMIKKCETCRGMVDKFKEGMERTNRYNFAGGDVDWEEKKLGSYATSETRFIEITEHLCDKSAHECNAMFEEHEEMLEKWWKTHQESDDLLQWLCIDNIKVCCPENKYGPDCEECIGGLERPCRDNGKCSGGGTRGGTGKCKCDGGYKGTYCEVCKNGFHEVLNNETHTICKACDDSCASTCTSEGPKGCNKCRGGYVNDEEEGCKDINECDDQPCNTNQFCENSRGSFSCVDCDSSCNSCLGASNTMCVQCKDGYTLVEEACTDINECEQEGICEEDMACTNLPGSHYCDCKEGFTRMGEQCVDKELLKEMKNNKMAIPDPDLGVKDNKEATDFEVPETDAIHSGEQSLHQELEKVNLPSSDDVSTNHAKLEQINDLSTDDPIVNHGSFQSQHLQNKATSNVDAIRQEDHIDNQSNDSHEEL